VTGASVSARSGRTEAGDTLLEVLLALLVLGIAALAILLAFTTSIIGSTEYRDLSTVDTVLRSAAESATSQIQQQPASAWAACTDTSGVVFDSTTGYTPPANYDVEITSVTYWNPATSTFGATCVPNSAQLIQLSVTYKGNTYTISFVIDDPQTRPISPSGAATHLAFIGQPGSTISGSPISPAPVVAVEDAQNRIVTTDLSPVSIAITPGTGTPGATLSSNCAGIEFYGVVTFSNCSTTMVGSNYTLTATDGLLTSATSATFNVSPAPASQLVFIKAPIGQPASATAASGPFQVQEQDLYGNPIAASSPVILTVSTTSAGTTGNAPFFSLTQGGSSSSGVTTITIPSGSSSTASFYYADTLAGTPTLTASNAVLIDATTTISVTPGAATALAYTTPPPAATSTNTSHSGPTLSSGGSA